jgi:DNA-directed RNA polymerase subunit RPC12/RpoP
VVLILVGLCPLLVAMPFMIRIEQTAGYYVCAKCGHKYVPTYKSVFLAMHTGRTRYMKCPHCAQKSWQKKVLTKD